MKKFLLSSAAFVALGLAPALAADLPSRKTAPVFVPAPVYSWTGFYAGANLGWGFTDGDGRIVFLGNAGRISGDGDGFFGGVQAGYNFQMGSWVLGAEADFQGSTGEGTQTTVFANPAIGAGGIGRNKVETPWFGTLRGRVGYAFDRLLVYATGGLAYGRIEVNGIGSETYATYTVGAGVEAALRDRWTVKVEYLYVGTPSDVPAPVGTAAFNGDSNSHLVRVGLNYRF